MRLSLKTILAYTDNLFDAEYRPVIDKRIGEEDAARRLIDRIRSVMRDPDLPVPGRSGEKEELSANLIAAYLDHQLSDAEQAQFEAICLRSDVFLAEIACSHQILTTTLGQPAKMSRDCRLRVYAISRHRKESPVAAVDESNAGKPEVKTEENTCQPPVETETAPPPRKKRRITVTAHENVASQTMTQEKTQEPSPDHDAILESVLTAQTGNVAATEQSPPPRCNETTWYARSGEKISRLGQAFAHRKRRRQIMLVSSLVLFFLCVSIYLLAHRNPRQPERAIANYRPLAPATDIVAAKDEKDNNQRLAESHGMWGHRDATSLSGGPANITPVAGELVARADSMYTLHESPGTVMQYMPGQQAASPQANPSVIPAAPAALPASPAQQFAAQFPPGGQFQQQQLPNPTAQQTVAQPPASSPNTTQQIPSFQPVGMAVAGSVTSHGATSAVGGAATNPVAGNVMSGDPYSAGQSQTAWQMTVRGATPQQAQPSQWHTESESTIQLIDRGSAQSVRQFINPSLPAVQPAPWGADGNSEKSRDIATARPGDQASFPNHSRSPVSAAYFPGGTQAEEPPIEQASYTPDPQRPGLPPLLEPNWNETNNGGFEHVADMPRVESINTQANTATDTFQQQEQTASQLPLPRQMDGSVNPDAAQPLRMPDRVALNGRSNSLAPSRQRHSVANENIVNSGYPMLLLDKEEIALVRETPEAEWSWLPVSRQLVNDIVLVPAPFRALIRFPNGIVVETEGDTRVQILPDDEAGRPTLAFDCGHLIIYASRDRLSYPDGTNGVEEPTGGRIPNISPSLRLVTPVGGGVLRFTDSQSFVSIDSENKTTVKLFKVARPYESVTANPALYRHNLDNNVTYCPNLMAFPAPEKAVFWQKDGKSIEWELGTASIFPIDTEKSADPIILYDTNNLTVAPIVTWPSLVSHDGNIPISKLDLKNQFVTMPQTFYPTPSKTWLLK